MYLDKLNTENFNKALAVNKRKFNEVQELLTPLRLDIRLLQSYCDSKLHIELDYLTNAYSILEFVDDWFSNGEVDTILTAAQEFHDYTTTRNLSEEEVKSTYLQIRKLIGKFVEDALDFYNYPSSNLDEDVDYALLKLTRTAGWLRSYCLRKGESILMVGSHWKCEEHQKTLPRDRWYQQTVPSVITELNVD